MGSTYLSLTNQVLRHFNEVELTSATFATATGFQAVAKDYVNDTIREIQQAEYEWPFNWYYTLGTTTGSIGQYDLPVGTVSFESVDWESFSIERDDTADPVIYTKKLEYIDYDEWLQKYKEIDDNREYDATGQILPQYVYRTQDSKYGLSPVPNLSLVIRFEWWGYEAELSAYTDTTSIPSRFDHVIKDGAIAKGYIYRSDNVNAQYFRDKHEKGVRSMRELLINRYKTLRDNRVNRYG